MLLGTFDTFSGVNPAVDGTLTEPEEQAAAPYTRFLRRRRRRLHRRTAPIAPAATSPSGPIRPVTVLRFASLRQQARTQIVPRALTSPEAVSACFRRAAVAAPRWLQAAAETTAAYSAAAAVGC